MAEFGNRISTVQSDVNDHGALVKLLKDVDLVVCTLGPFYKFGDRIVRACIEAGVNYLDIDDDFDSTRECLELDEQARAAGILAVKGCGASPGITNMLAKYAADKLDSVDDIRIFWGQSGIDPTGSGAMLHWFHITADMIPVYRDGKWVDVRGFTDPEEVDFLPPIGRMKCYYTGHPEPVSLPRYVKGVKNVSIKGCMYPPSIMDFYKVLDESGMGKNDDLILTDQFRMPMREVAVRITRAMPFFAPEFFMEEERQCVEVYKNIAGVQKLVVNGLKGGEKTTYIYDYMGENVTQATTIPAAMGAIMLLEGKGKGKGVLGPEAVFAPEPFIASLKTEGTFNETEQKLRVL
jgi:saccharopine dehydrogenase (NAD+, L-lysine-forming)